ncbi:glycosyltransferase family 25 protein [Rubinisphaera sp.]|mgnify:FL=1|uniref:glycosyltransferase family 25 protein n=1 Tax=Rubinisphaera sp. TaxID=2024857 RepID=UPI000C0E3CCC|nr:glycosyltransferase family 25 protein [Rubinisphaera sp.]MBV09293.1 glycosyl transferase family 25 [Rubinisphaera sp.]HCS51899.1 glycosyl transferase family 25 [Planctomycetaceae bacterium]
METSPRSCPVPVNSDLESSERFKQTFDAIYCINLDRRQDRWEQFQKRIPGDWPFREIERVSAVEGKQVPAPEWWKQGNGAWGCYRTHLQLIENALNRGLDSILLLEDDAEFCPDFTQEVIQFLDAIPEDWGMLYLGGQHLYVNAYPPQRISERVFQPYNVNRTHAFALRGRTMKKVYQHLCRRDWQNGHHIDHHLGRFHQRREDPIYCPDRWLIGQAEGRSNIAGKSFQLRYWKDAQEIDKIRHEEAPFVGVLGLHSSGSSCLAGVLHHLGFHMGNEFSGYYGKNPESQKCGFEAVGLSSLCEQAFPFPETKSKWLTERIENQLRLWINEKRREACEKNTIAGGKYPQLCLMGNALHAICQDHLKLIVSNRPIEQSIESLCKRFPDIDSEIIIHHQKILENGKQELIGKLRQSAVLIVEYEELLQSPRKQMERIIKFCEINPSEEQMEKACHWVDPNLQHVGRLVKPGAFKRT